MNSDAKECSFEGCVRFQHCKSLCAAHYLQRKRGTPLRPLRVAVPHKVCQFDGCTQPNKYRGWCNTHNLQEKKWGVSGMKPLRRRSDDPDGWLVTKDGYRQRSARRSDGTFFVQLEHRYVMEQMIGRPLLRIEQVHHKNGKRDDNRPGNLELWYKGQPAGQRAKDLLEWAEQIIALYGADKDKLQ